MIKPVKNPFRAIVNGILNDIIDAVNRQEPVQGNGITLLPSPSGTTISIIPADDSGNPSQQSSSSGSSGDDDSALQIQISSLQTQLSLALAQIQILQQEMPIGHFQPVNVVDTANGCAKSTISVFVKN